MAKEPIEPDANDEVEVENAIAEVQTETPAMLDHDNPAVGQFVGFGVTNIGLPNNHCTVDPQTGLIESVEPPLD